jgi:hypothetical protein
MERISVGKSNKSCSCNNCSARNYESRISFGKKVDKLYSLEIGSAVVTLCKDCLEKLYYCIGDFSEFDHPTEKGGAENG